MKRKPVQQSTVAESLMMASLIYIARSKPKCDGSNCRWDEPCGQCFAAQTIDKLCQVGPLRRWKKSFRIVPNRKVKRK